jgi:hypothetical protein
MASPAGCSATTVWAPPRSLAATEGILSFPRGTEMFQFPRCPLMAHTTSARPCAGRVAPFGNLRIAGCQRLPGAFRRVAASFLGRQRQGIHRALVIRRPITIRARLPRSPTTPRSAPVRTGARQQGRSRPPSAPAPSRPRSRRMRHQVRLTDSPTPPPDGPSPDPPRTGPCPISHIIIIISLRAVRAGDRTRVTSARRLPRPRNPAGLAWRIVKVPTCWASTHGDPSARPRGCPPKGTPGVEPRGFEPRTSAVQGRRSPG